MQDLLSKVLSDLSKKIPDMKYLSSIKSGKEADVHLVRDYKRLYALKIYKLNTKYSTKLDYMLLDSFLDARQRRAIKKRTNKGIEMFRSLWTFKEFEMLKKLFEYSTNIPEVFEYTEDSILMEYIGDEISTAPRLSEVKLSIDEAKFAFDEIIENIKLFIDFPQVLDIKNNPNAHSKLLKDLENIKQYFLKYLDKKEVNIRINEVLNYYYKS